VTAFRQYQFGTREKLRTTDATTGACGDRCRNPWTGSENTAQRRSGECRAGCCYVFGSQDPTNISEVRSEPARIRTDMRREVSRSPVSYSVRMEKEQASFLLSSVYLPAIRNEQRITAGVIDAIPCEKCDYRPDEISKCAMDLALAYYIYRNPVYGCCGGGGIRPSPESAAGIDSDAGGPDCLVQGKFRAAVTESRKHDCRAVGEDDRVSWEAPAFGGDVSSHNDEPFRAPSRSIVRVFATDGRESAGYLRRELRFGAGASGGPTGVRLTRRATRDV